MKRLLLIGLLAIGLGGCATLQADWAIITGTTVSPTQIIVAANAFDAGEASATQYLSYCQASGAGQTACALPTRQAVVKAVRAGRIVRNQLEPYITSGTAGPAAIYNTLVAVVTQLQGAIPATTGVK